MLSILFRTCHLLLAVVSTPSGGGEGSTRSCHFFFPTPWLPRLLCYEPVLPQLVYCTSNTLLITVLSRVMPPNRSHLHLTDWSVNPSSHPWTSRTTLTPFLFWYSSWTSRPLKMKAVGSFEASMLQHQSPEEQKPEHHHHENFSIHKSETLLLLLLMTSYWKLLSMCLPGCRSAGVYVDMWHTSNIDFWTHIITIRQEEDPESGKRKIFPYLELVLIKHCF